jgi:branched-chain amino acid transport system substrate-binding protein
VTEIGDNIFRVCFIDPFQGQMIAKFAKKLGFTKAAVFRDIKNDYSVGLAGHLDAFHALGSTIVADEAYSEETRTSRPSSP